MQRFFVSGNKQQPTVELDQSKGIFKFEGRSIVGNPVEFYSPIRDWFKEYCANPNEKTIIEIRMDYFNSSTFKELIDIFKLLKTIKEQGLQVKWYTYDDDDIIEETEKITEISGVEIELVML